MIKNFIFLLGFMSLVSCASHKPIWDVPQESDIVVSFSKVPTSSQQYLGDFIVEEVGSNLAKVRHQAIAKMTANLRKAGGNYLYVTSMESVEGSAGWFKSPGQMLEKKVRIEAQGYFVK